MRVLPQPGGPVEQDPLRRRQLVLGEQVLVDEGQLDGVGDLLDLVVEATHVVVGDVGDLLQHQLLDLGAGQALEQQARAGVHQGVVAGPEALAGEGVGQVDDPLLVGPPDDQGPTVVHDLLDDHDLAGDLARAGQDHVERLVEHDLAAADQVLGGQLGVHRHPHLAPAGVDVDGAVVVDAEQGAVGRRRLGELLDLFAEGGDVLAGLAERVGQLLVLGDGLGQLALGLEQALLEGAHPLRGLLQPTAEDDDLLLHLRQLLAGGEDVVVGRPARCAITWGADGDHLLGGDLTHVPSAGLRHLSACRDGTRRFHRDFRVYWS